MLNNSLNSYQGTTWCFDELTAVAARRYGSGSQAVAFILYEELISTRRLLIADPAASLLAARVATLRDQIQRLYDEGGYLKPGPPPNARIVVAGPPAVVEYDRAVFDAKVIEDAPGPAAGIERQHGEQVLGAHLGWSDPAADMHLTECYSRHSRSICHATTDTRTNGERGMEAAGQSALC